MKSLYKGEEVCAQQRISCVLGSIVGVGRRRGRK
jgi:hypothetical protein